jgi:hypothetical protein
MSEQVDFELIKAWLKQCSAKHGDSCSDLEHHTVRGMRLIDCYSQKFFMAPDGTRYAALSYVWASTR